MNESLIRIVDLIEKHLKDEITPEEKQELESWKNQSESNGRIFEKLTENDYLFKAINNSYVENSTEKVRQKINKLIEADQGEKEKVVPFRRFTWRKMIPAAAAIIALVASVAYFWLQTNKTEPASKTEQQLVINDKVPGKDGAILKLANGQEIVLDNAANGSLTQQGSTAITKQGNLLAYNNGANSGEVLYNTLSTPVGRQFQLALPDGSRIWLNSGSSVTYPTEFTGNERKVTVSGEVYMEVSKNAAKPFRVQVTPPPGEINGATIEVLGTQFNVNGYGDETLIKTTLVEGKVKITNGNSIALLTPGQQAQVNAGNISVKKDADIEKETAWRNGWFNFKSDKLKNIMPQISRWYDVDIVYVSSDVQNIIVTGEIERNANLSEVLKILTYLKIDYKIEGRKLILKG